VLIIVGRGPPAQTCVRPGDMGDRTYL